MRTQNNSIFILALILCSLTCSLSAKLRKESKITRGTQGKGAPGFAEKDIEADCQPPMCTSSFAEKEEAKKITHGNHGAPHFAEKDIEADCQPPMCTSSFAQKKQPPADQVARASDFAEKDIEADCQPPMCTSS